MAYRKKTRSRKSYKGKSRKIGRRHKTYRRKVRGGEAAGSATAYGEAVYGNASNQHAEAGSNLIARNYIENR